MNTIPYLSLLFWSFICIFVSAVHAANVHSHDMHPKILQDEIEQIYHTRIEQNAALARGDAVAAAKFWTEDVTLRRGLGHATSGKEAYIQLIDQSPSNESIIYTRTPEIIDVSNQFPLAFESGSWIGKIGAEDGPTVIAGKYSAQWVKREHTWYIRSEVFVALTQGSQEYAFKALP